MGMKECWYWLNLALKVLLIRTERDNGKLTEKEEKKIRKKSRQLWRVSTFPRTLRRYIITWKEWTRRTFVAMGVQVRMTAWKGEENKKRQNIMQRSGK